MNSLVEGVILRFEVHREESEGVEACAGVEEVAVMGLCEAAFLVLGPGN